MFPIQDGGSAVRIQSDVSSGPRLCPAESANRALWSSVKGLVYRNADNADLRMLRMELKSGNWRALSTWLALGCTKVSWIIFKLSGRTLVEAWVLLTHRNFGLPLECVRIHRRTSGEPVDGGLFRFTVDCAREFGSRELFCSFSADFSQRALLADLGFNPWREVCRYESSVGMVPTIHGYRTVEARRFARAEIISLIEQVSEFSDDSQTIHFRQMLGTFADATLTLEMLELVPHDDTWWVVALDSNGQKIGLILPVLNYGELTIGFVGVIPAFRGQGIASGLLKTLFPIARRSGHSVICAEVDRRNTSMQKALVRDDFQLTFCKQEWRLVIAA